MIHGASRAYTVTPWKNKIAKTHQRQVWANSAQLNSLLAVFAQVAPLQIATALGNKLLTHSAPRSVERSWKRRRYPVRRYREWRGGTM